jgi:dipeptidyl-peptidase-4
VSPDGERVTFLRGRADNQFQLDLWEYSMKDKTMHRLVDSKKLVPTENLSLEEKARRERARTASLVAGWQADPGADRRRPLPGRRRQSGCRA